MKRFVNRTLAILLAVMLLAGPSITAAGRETAAEAIRAATGATDDPVLNLPCF